MNQVSKPKSNFYFYFKRNDVNLRTNVNICIVSSTTKEHKNAFLHNITALLILPSTLNIFVIWLLNTIDNDCYVQHFVDHLHHFLDTCYDNATTKSSKPCFLPVHVIVSEWKYEKSCLRVSDGNEGLLRHGSSSNGLLGCGTSCHQDGSWKIGLFGSGRVSGQVWA